jgi:hypothetical protein
MMTTTTTATTKEASRRDILRATMAVVAISTVVDSSPSIANAVGKYDDGDDDDDGAYHPAPNVDDDGLLSIPLEYIPALDAYVVYYRLFGEKFGAIIDTGSPFLTCPSTCSKHSYKYRWGCYRPERTQDSGLANTIEGYDNNQGPVVWRRAEFALVESNDADDEDAEWRESTTGHRGEEGTTTLMTFGVIGPELLDGPGGVFLGLIRDTDKWIRPSFLGQTRYVSFIVDLRETPKLVLSKRSMMREYDDYIPLVRDLNRRYGDPVVHYTAKAHSFVVNGLSLKLDERHPTYVIFDTGLSGMAVSDELYDGRNIQARKNRERSLWGDVRVSFETRNGDVVELRAKKPITTPLGKDTSWTRVRGNIIVLGLAFLVGNALTIDIDDDKLAIATMA